jgi:hypothetical protein
MTPKTLAKEGGGSIILPVPLSALVGTPPAAGASPRIIEIDHVLRFAVSLAVHFAPTRMQEFPNFCMRVGATSLWTKEARPSHGSSTARI